MSKKADDYHDTNIDKNELVKNEQPGFLSGFGGRDQNFNRHLVFPPGINVNQRCIRHIERHNFMAFCPALCEDELR